MDQNYFRKNIEDIIKNCYVNLETEEKAGFKLAIENNNIISITNTVEMLLIMELLYGKNFSSNGKVERINFDRIKKFFIETKNSFLEMEEHDIRKEKTIHVAYCGIGLILLKDINSAMEIYNLLAKKRATDDNMWGKDLGDLEWDLYATYVVTMLMNRLHLTCVCPMSIKEMLNTDTKDGIAFYQNSKNKYVEALTLAVYMGLFYYNDNDYIYSQAIENVNSYYLELSAEICNCIADRFVMHNTHHIFAFGLAAHVVRNLKHPFYMKNNHNILEYLNHDFINIPKKNIPFCLELCRLYTAIKLEYDPFKQDILLDEVNMLKATVKEIDQSISDVKKELEDRDNNMKAKIAITTAAYIIFFVLVIGIIYIIMKGIIDTVSLEDNLSKALVKFIEICSTVAVFVFTVLQKWSRKILKIITDKICKYIDGKDHEAS